VTAFRLIHARNAQPAQAAEHLCNLISDAIPSAATDQASKHKQPDLALLYMNAAAAEQSASVLQILTKAHPAITWVGASAHSVIVNNEELGGEPVLAAMLLNIEPGSWSPFSSNNPISSEMHTALVHADPGVQDIVEAVQGLSDRTQTGFLFGGLTSGNNNGLGEQICDGQSLTSGLSGVAFDERVRLLSRVTQGCSPLAAEHVVTQATDNYVHELDNEPALDVLLRDLGVDEKVRESRDPDQLLAALPSERLSNGLLVGLNETIQDRSMGFGDYLVRNLIGIDPDNRLIAVGAEPATGDRLVFCTRDKEAARADLIRMCTELRDEVESDGLTILGAHYVSCLARGQALFESIGAEASLLTHNLGDVPVIGFFANGEIARERLYAHTGVLTLFVQPDPARNN
jgi:small ligand-binding sensory domain FIST